MVSLADLFLTYMDSERPRLVRNVAKVHHLNSLYGVRLNPEFVDLAKVLPIASLNSITTLGAEMIGRSYGGGMLKLEPREADQLPMPSPDLVKSRSQQLISIEAQASTMAAQGKLMDACEMVDKVLFPRGHQISSQTLDDIRQMRFVLRGRRLTRGAKSV